jgi:hypothetical protein
VQTILLSGFDPEGEPEIRVWADGSLEVVFNFMPPSWAADEAPDDLGRGNFADFDRQMERAVGVPVLWEDREFFRIEQPAPDTLERVRQFVERYRSRQG